MLILLFTSKPQSMNKQEQLAEQIAKAEELLYKHVAGDTGLFNNEVYCNFDKAAAAIVEAMGVQQEKEQPSLQSGKLSAEEVLYKHVLADADNHVMGTTLTVTVPPLEELKNNQQFQMHVAAMKEYAQQVYATAAPAKAVEAIPESDYKYSLNERKFQEIQFKGLGISDEQTFEQQVNTAIALAWECLELRKKVEAMDSLPAYDKDIEKRLVSMMEERPERLLMYFLSILGREMVKTNATDLELSQHMDIEGKRYKVKAECGIENISANEDYVPSNSNTDDTSLASHSCNSIGQKFKNIKDRKRQLKEQFEKSLPPKNIRAWMKEKTEKTFEINNGNLDKQSFHLGMNAMWNYCYSHKLLNNEQNVQVSDTTESDSSTIADNQK
jgi:hypothetical protein